MNRFTTILGTELELILIYKDKVTKTSRNDYFRYLTEFPPSLTPD